MALFLADGSWGRAAGSWAKRIAAPNIISADTIAMRGRTMFIDVILRFRSAASGDENC
jgi:hypothetical protein